MLYPPPPPKKIFLVLWKCFDVQPLFSYFSNFPSAYYIFRVFSSVKYLLLFKDLATYSSLEKAIYIVPFATFICVILLLSFPVLRGQCIIRVCGGLASCQVGVVRIVSPRTPYMILFLVGINEDCTRFGSISINVAIHLLTPE
jgi:hypothetical protein